MFSPNLLPSPRLARLLLATCTIGLISLSASGAGQTTQPASPSAAPPAAPQATPPAAKPAAPAATPSQPEDVQKTIDKLKQTAPAATPAVPVPAPRPTPQAPAAPSASTPTTPTAEAPPPTTGRLQREGTFLASRRGRVIKTPTGEWQYHFDTGPDNRTDLPMVLMPCLNLQAIEKLAERGGEALSFTISGQVFVYKGRNHLLPTLYTVNRRGDVTPAQ